jgi:2-haloacid dehalogenase
MSVASAAMVATAPVGPIQAVAFDAFPILDPRPVFALARQLFPNQGDNLVDLWRKRQFEYTWLRSLSRRYVDFWQVTEEALIFAARALRADLTARRRERLMSAYLSLVCWPEAPAVLHALKDSGLRLAFLSNMTERMLHAGIDNSNLAGVFDYVLTTDRVRAYKPDPLAYQMGVHAFDLKREEILFVAFAGWDAAGASSFGYPTYWLNRERQPIEELGARPTATGATLVDLAKYLSETRSH